MPFVNEYHDSIASGNGSFPSDEGHTSSDSDEVTEIEDMILTLRSSDSTTVRLPSGKTISNRRTPGSHTSKHRPRKTPSPTSSIHPSKKLRGNCAMIRDPSPTTTQTPTRAPPPKHTRDPLSSSSDHDTTSIQPSPSSNHPSSLDRIRLTTRNITIRSSDAQMLAGLPLTQQHALLATAQKAVAKADRAGQHFRAKMDSHGNLKSKERFVNDVPGGKSHRNRFMAQ
ncbi:hypothetical protein N0V90_001602 [Kalmusia sp. IMI 367209]|nr:hypothetical protein N0V90_001602 [Kalmusia sp. IMI 367209]